VSAALDAAPPALILVVPCFNEAERLAEAPWVAWLDAEPDVNLLFVDDGSADGTGPILAGWAARHPRVSTLTLPTNRGKAEAVRAGLLAAFGRGAPIAGYWDADLATPLSAVARLRAALSRDPELWVALGSRVALLGAHIERSAARHYLGRVAATLASWVLNLVVYDTQCGAKLLRDAPAVRAALGAPWRTTWTFDVELLGRLLDAPGGGPRRLVEVPVPAWRDVRGSKVGWRDVLRAPLELWTIWRHRARR
jgi:glycosyltransferase involved in cell wall biosynthesis